MRYCLLLLAPLALCEQVKVPKTWDDAALADWATSIAGINVRPAHFSAEEYYKAPIDNLRAYPVYWPDREPKGYWKMLNSTGPRPLIEPEKLKTEADWITAGQRVFKEYDLPPLRVSSPEAITAARSLEALGNTRVLPDGTLEFFRSVPTAEGVKLSFLNCAFCHMRVHPDGTQADGLPNVSPIRNALFRFFQPNPAAVILVGDSVATGRWRAFHVPWVKDDIHEGLRDMAARQSTWGGSGLSRAHSPAGTAALIT